MIQANNKIPLVNLFSDQKTIDCNIYESVFKKYPMQVENTDQKPGEEETLFLSPSLSVSRSNYKYY